MSITVYPDVILPNSVIEAGVRGKQIRKNTRVTTFNGQEFINIGWTQTLREFEIGFVPMRRQAWQDIEALFEITEGGAFGFLMEDPKDMDVTGTGGVVTALTSTTFQLWKTYRDTASTRTKFRKITRPRALGFSVSVSGTPLAGGAYSLNTETGVLTIASAPTSNTVTWTGLFYVPVHFQSDAIDWTLAIAGGNANARFLSGPSVVLEEVRE